MTYTLLFEATPFNISTGVTTLVHMTGANTDYRTTDINGYAWTPCITAAPQCSVTVWDNGAVADATTQWTELGFRISAQLGNQTWLTYKWGGQLGRLWYGKVGDPFSNFTKVFEGTLSDIHMQNGVASLTFTGPEALLNNSLCNTYYTGTGGANGGADLSGQRKPKAFGNCQNVEPIQVNTQFEVYQVNDGQVNDITAVYENALSLGTSAGDYATYSLLTAATLATGTWATCKAQGYFRLGSKPKGVITADILGGYDATVGYASTMANILPSMMRVVGVSNGQIDQTAFNTLTNTWNYYCKDDTQVGDIVRAALSSRGTYMLTTSAGAFSCGSYLSSASATQLNQDRSTLPLVNSVVQEMPAEPAYRLKLGGGKNWRVQSKEEISSAIYDASSDISGAVATAAAAQSTANLAASNAATAMAEVTNLVDDTVLSRADKPLIVRENDRIIAEKSGIDATATSLGLTTQQTAYDSAYSTLQTYLSGLSPAYNDYTQDTTGIVPATFETKFNNLYAARQDLLNQAAQMAAIVGYLTNEAVSLPASNAGVVSSFANANGSFVVMQGPNNISEQCSFSVVSSTGTGLTYTLSNTAGSRGQYIVTAGWTENTPASIRMRATFGTVSFDRTFTLAKSMAGAAGSPGTPGTNGNPAVAGYLTNESHTVATAADGSGGDYSAAGGQFHVVAGSTDISTGNGISYVVQSVTSGLSITINSSTGGYTVTGSSVDTATATLRATGTVNGTAVTIDKVYTIDKSKQGTNGSNGSPGANAKTLVVSSDRQTIAFDGSGTLTPALQPINFSAFKQNTTATVTWSITDLAGNAVSNTYLSATTGDNVSMTAANFVTARGATLGVIVTATDSTDSLSDKISVVSVQQGANGSPGSPGTPGTNGTNGRDALVYYQLSTSSPSSGGLVVGDTWFQTDTKRWLRWNGTSWVQIYGAVAQYDTIDAAAISAGVIAAGVIGTNQLGANSITTTQLAASSVTAAKMNVTSLDTITATIGTMQSASSGQRVVISTTLISVYDANNITRVKLGIF